MQIYLYNCNILCLVFANYFDVNQVRNYIKPIRIHKYNKYFYLHHSLIAKLRSFDKLSTQLRNLIPKSEKVCEKHQNSVSCHSERSEESSLYATFWILQSLRSFRMTMFSHSLMQRKLALINDFQSIFIYISSVCIPIYRGFC
jgi:hypothetical protein